MSVTGRQRSRSRAWRRHVRLVLIASLTAVLVFAVVTQFWVVTVAFGWAINRGRISHVVISGGVDYRCIGVGVVVSGQGIYDYYGVDDVSFAIPSAWPVVYVQPYSMHPPSTDGTLTHVRKYVIDWLYQRDPHGWPAKLVGVSFGYVPLILLLGYGIRYLGKAPYPYGHCPNCGYDLRATPHRCPECGRVPEKAEGRGA